MPKESGYAILMRTRDNFLEEVTNYCLLGCTNRELGEFFGVTEQQITGWLRPSSPQQIKEFAQAVEEGRQRADVRVARAMLKRAEGYEYTDQRLVVKDGHAEVIDLTVHVPPDTSAGKFWLVNRSGHWREKQNVELTGRDGGALETELTVKFVGVARPDQTPLLPAVANEPELIEQDPQ